MDYDKGPQITVGYLKRFLATIPDDVKICVGIGDASEAAHYLLNDNGMLLLHPDCYMQNANETNIKTMISFQKD